MTSPFLIGLSSILINSFVSCTTLYYNPFKELDIAEETVPYVLDFVKDARIYGNLDINAKSLQIKMVNMPHELGASGYVTVGVCYYQAATWKESPLVIVSKEYWKYATEFQKKALIYHELGHCLLDREHIDTLHEVEGGVLIHDSIMNPTVIHDWEFMMYRDYYYKELFTNVSEEIQEKWRPQYHGFDPTLQP